MDLMSLELSDKLFAKISRMVYRICGINLKEEKIGMVKARLTKRLRVLGLNSFEDYMKFVVGDESGKELTVMIDVLTTNKTSFFRESQHFDFLSKQILPELIRKKKRIRLWSAGCSSGEEPFTLALMLKEIIPDLQGLDARILATDISTDVLAKAREAVYDKNDLDGVPRQLLGKYFSQVRAKAPPVYQLNDNIRSMVKLARLNLMSSWPMQGPFDVIFCRNVMIYFDGATRERLVQRFWEILGHGGYLFVGHSESLASSSHAFRYVQPAVYSK